MSILKAIALIIIVLFMLTVLVVNIWIIATKGTTKKEKLSSLAQLVVIGAWTILML